MDEGVTFKRVAPFYVSRGTLRLDPFSESQRLNRYAKAKTVTERVSQGL